ncbi:MAG: sugar-binding protein [Oscillospiraceae bacterium]|nr:sugar-binding protein [Oscillospiraceae bacterium]
MIALLLPAIMVLSLLAACGTSTGKDTNKTDTTGGDTTQSGEAKKMVGICMPTKEQTIWSIQGERLEEAFQDGGYDTRIDYAEDDASKQAMQIENMITKGVDVLVIAAVDCASLTDAVEKAKAAGIYVIADDRLITNTEAVDYYVTFDLVRLGEIQGQYIVDKLDLKNVSGPFSMEIFSGSQDDTNSASFYKGEMNILQPYLDSGKLVVKSSQVSLAETAVQSWDSSKAQSRMDNLLSGFYADEPVDVVLCAADCVSMGVISSLESMGYGTEAQPYPIITGQDAELANIKYIEDGKQSMTVFLDANKLAGIIVPLVDSLVAGETVEPDITYNNGVFDVPTKTYDPYLIDKDNVNYLVEVGFYTQSEISG